MKKTVIVEKNSTKVVFSLPKEDLEGVSIVSIVGDFTEWNPVMFKAKKDDSFEVELEVPTVEIIIFVIKLTIIIGKMTMPPTDMKPRQCTRILKILF